MSVYTPESSPPVPGPRERGAVKEFSLINQQHDCAAVAGRGGVPHLSLLGAITRVVTAVSATASPHLAVSLLLLSRFGFPPVEAPATTALYPPGRLALRSILRLSCYVMSRRAIFRKA